jgi:hypothetical protein
MNLIGLVPAFEFPDNVPVGSAGTSHLHLPLLQLLGFQVQGVLGYLKHFAGPMLVAGVVSCFRWKSSAT